MKLIRKVLSTLPPMLAVGVLLTGGAMAEPDAPRQCLATGTGPDYPISMTVEKSFCRDSIGFACQTDSDCPTAGDKCLTESAGLVRFAYAIEDPHSFNPDHSVISFDAVPVCAASVCSLSGTACVTSDECLGTGAGDENEDVCLVDSDCIFAAGETTDPYPSISSGLQDPGEGDSSTIIGRYEKSRRVMTANPNQAVSRFYLDISGQVTCDLGDVLVKTGKKISSCPICVPLTAADLGIGAFANTEKIVTLGNCKFSRVFEAGTGRLISSEVLGEADPDGPPCEGIVVSTDQDPQSGTFGQLISKGAGEGTLPPMPFNNFQFNVGDGGTGPVDFGLGLQDQAGGNEWTSGSGTCVTLSDGFGGTSLSCTCQKPLSKGEIRYCR